VIKDRFAPAICVVATGTVGTQGTLMHITVQVAADTRRAKALEFGGRTRLLVTANAGGRGVLALKREGELVMVEFGVAVYPIVASHTVCAEIGDVACDKVGLIPGVAILAERCRKRVGSGRVWCLG
jgi:hypothetical protein